MSCLERCGARLCRASCCECEYARLDGWWWMGGDDDADFEMGVMNRSADNADGGRTAHTKSAFRTSGRTARLTTVASFTAFVGLSHARQTVRAAPGPRPRAPFLAKLRQAVVRARHALHQARAVAVAPLGRTSTVAVPPRAKVERGRRADDRLLCERGGRLRARGERRGRAPLRARQVLRRRGDRERGSG